MTVLLGRTTAGTTGTFIAQNDAGAWKFTADATGDLVRIWFQSKVLNDAGGGATTSVQLGIYSHNAGTNKPNALLGSGTNNTAAEIQGTGLFSVTLGTPVPVTAGTVYWLAIWTTGAGGWDFQGNAGGSYSGASPGAGGLAATWAETFTDTVDPVIWGEDAGAEPAYRTPPSPMRHRLPGCGPRGLVERRWTEEITVGGVTYTVDLSADGVPSAVTVLQAGKIVSAPSSASATLERTVNAIRSASNTATASVVRQAARILSASSTGTAVLVRLVGKVLSAGSTATASIATVKVKLVTLTATAAVTAVLIREVRLPRSVTATGTASVVRRVGKVLAASSTATATLATLKVILRTLTATATGTASVVRRAGKALSAASTGTGAITLGVRLTRSATAAGTAQIIRRVGRALSASSTGTATIAATRVFLVALQAAAVSTASLRRDVRAVLRADVTTAPTLTKRITRTLSVTATGVGVIAMQLLSDVYRGLGEAFGRSSSVDDATGGSAGVDDYGSGSSGMDEGTSGGSGRAG